MGDNSLINLGDISRPATTLIEKVSDAIGGYCKPYPIKRVAKAEAEADLIKAEGQIEIDDLTMCLGSGQANTLIFIGYHSINRYFQGLYRSFGPTNGQYRLRQLL